MFSANQTSNAERKDSVINAEQTGHFVWNLATWNLREAVNTSAASYPPDVDEFDEAGLEKERARLTNIPMVKASPVKFECDYHTTIRLPGNPPMGTVDVIIGKVVAVHISEDVLTDGILDVRKTMPIARCGYYQYAVVKETFEMIIPGMDENLLSGLEGSSKANRAAAQRQIKRSHSSSGGVKDVSSDTNPILTGTGTKATE